MQEKTFLKEDVYENLARGIMLFLVLYIYVYIYICL